MTQVGFKTGKLAPRNGERRNEEHDLQMTMDEGEHLPPSRAADTAMAASKTIRATQAALVDAREARQKTPFSS